MTSYEDAVNDRKLLLEFARLQLRIAHTRAPSIERFTLNEENVANSVGFKTLHKWWRRLSAPAKRKARVMFRQQIDGVKEIVANAKASGEPLSLADIVIEIRDVEDDPPKPDKAGCKGSGGGITSPVADRVHCVACKASWHVNDIGFRIPRHEEKT